MMITIFQKIDYSTTEENGTLYTNVQFFLEHSHVASLKSPNNAFTLSNLEYMKKTYLNSSLHDRISKDTYLIKDQSTGTIVGVRFKLSAQLHLDTTHPLPWNPYGDDDEEEAYCRRSIPQASSRSLVCPQARV